MNLVFYPYGGIRPLLYVYICMSPRLSFLSCWFIPSAEADGYIILFRRPMSPSVQHGLEGTCVLGTMF